MATTTFQAPPSDPVSDGPRPVNLQTDLFPLADLIELCFGLGMDESGRAALREMRMMGTHKGLWRVLSGLDRLAGNLNGGYVWFEMGRLVGNVTLSSATYPREDGRGAIISNVAVHPGFRGRGIARNLLSQTIQQARAQGYQFVVLQVDADNPTAENLYRSLGFRAERTFTRWRRASHHTTPPVYPAMPRLWMRPTDEWRAEMSLAELVRPNRIGGLGWLRPVTNRAFKPGVVTAFIDSIVGTTAESYVVYRDEATRARSGIVGALRLTQTFGGADRFDLLVHPYSAGRLEVPLINYLLRRLSGRRRAIITEHPADDESGESALRAAFFEPKRSLTHMRMDFPRY